MYERAGNGTEPAKNRQELADFLYVDRSALSALMSRLAKRGLFTYHKNHFVLK